MTNIPSVEERATMFKEFYCECNGSMTSDAIYATTHRIITEDRTALLTELREYVVNLKGVYSAHDVQEAMKKKMEYQEKLLAKKGLTT